MMRALVETIIFIYFSLLHNELGKIVSNNFCIKYVTSSLSVRISFIVFILKQNASHSR